jgi:hypothetical protein
MVNDVYRVGEEFISGEWRQKSLCVWRSCVNIWDSNWEEPKLAWKEKFQGTRENI